MIAKTAQRIRRRYQQSRLGFIVTIAFVLMLTSCGVSRSRALVDAIISRNDQEVFRLLERGVDPNRPAIYREWEPKERDIILLTIPVLTSDKSEKREITPLIAAASMNNLTVARALIQKGAKVDKPGSYGWQALTCAVQNHHPEMVKLLLDLGASDHMGAETDYSTFLINAVKEGNVKGVELLLSAGMNVDGRDSKGRTALMTAVDSENDEEAQGKIILLLRSHGADPSLKDNQGKSAIDLARETPYFYRHWHDLLEWPFLPASEVKPIHWVEPAYPPEAKAEKIEDVVFVAVSIDIIGRICDADVLVGHHPPFFSTALDAVEQWVFKPHIENGVPKPAHFIVMVSFTLPNKVISRVIGQIPTSAYDESMQENIQGGVVGGVEGGVLGGIEAAPDAVQENAVRIPATAAKLLHRVDPVYPPAARAAKVEGVVVIDVVIDIYGRVSDARLVSGQPLLNESALRAVKQWIFEPFLVHGLPKQARFAVTVPFNLHDN